MYSSILRRLFLADEPPTPGKGVYLFFEFIALGFLLEAVAELRDGGRWYIVFGALILGGVFLWAGLKLPLLKDWLSGSDAGIPRSTKVLAVMLLLTWAFVVYEYTHHQPDGLTDRERLQTAVIKWGLLDGRSPGIIVDGHRLMEYQKTHRLIGLCFHDTGTVDQSDIPVSKSNLYDIVDAQQPLVIKFSETFIAEMNQGLRGTVYVALLVPIGVSADQFATIRQGRALGTKLVGSGAGSP